VTRKHLEDGLDALSTAVSVSVRSAGGPGVHAESGRGAEKSFGRAPATPADLIGRLAELALCANTLADIARTLSAERGDDASAELLACRRRECFPYLIIARHTHRVIFAGHDTATS